MDIPNFNYCKYIFNRFRLKNQDVIKERSEIYKNSLISHAAKMIQNSQGQEQGQGQGGEQRASQKSFGLNIWFLRNIWFLSCVIHV